MNTIKLIGVIAIALLITVPIVIGMIEKCQAKMDRIKDPWYWTVETTLYDGLQWVDKEFAMASDPDERGELRHMAQALVERYMEAMNYCKGEYTITTIAPMSEVEYKNFRKDLFVTLHGYSYESRYRTPITGAPYPDA